jgi:hypothetical protein
MYVVRVLKSLEWKIEKRNTANKMEIETTIVATSKTSMRRRPRYRCMNELAASWNVLTIVATASLMLASSASQFGTSAYSYSPQSRRTPSQQQKSYRRPPLTFQEFEFAPNGVCTFPKYFVEHSKPATSAEVNDDEDDNFHDSPRSYFTMRNVPGDGDCMFLAVALAAATSMGLGANDALLRAISRETRSVVAQILCSKGNLYISPGQVVEASHLLQSAVQQEPRVTSEAEYLEELRKEGREGGLYGGGPELAVLANILRRPISIYEVDKQRLKQQLYFETNENERIESCNDENAMLFPIVCKGSFGEGIFEDPCVTSISNSAVLSNAQPGAYSWRLHILVLNVSPGEKHACVLLPQHLLEKNLENET